jgi:hypothetical protein
MAPDRVTVNTDDTVTAIVIAGEVPVEAGDVTFTLTGPMGLSEMTLPQETDNFGMAQADFEPSIPGKYVLRANFLGIGNLGLDPSSTIMR